MNGFNVLLVKPAQSLAFPSAEYVREVIVADCNQHRDESQQSAVVIDGANLFHIDSTVAKVVSMGYVPHHSYMLVVFIVEKLTFWICFLYQVVKILSEDLKALGVPIYLWRWPPTVTQTLLGIDPKMKPHFRNVQTLDSVLCKLTTHLNVLISLIV